MPVLALKSRHQGGRAECCFAILERAANAGAVCPTNVELADMLGYSSGNGPSGLVNLLEVSGLITVERSAMGRVVTIAKTGKRTSGNILKRRATDWSADQDAIMMDALAAETGFTAIGRMIGKSKNACVSRFHKITAAMGEQAQ
ncbi:hypothetical protein ACWGM0_08670 [Sphingomonas bisphenolicum]